MTLIAKRPCSFGGRSFFIGDIVPSGMVTDPALQEKLGVVLIADSECTESTAAMHATFTQEQVEAMIAEAVEEAEQKRADQLTGLQEYAEELKETEPGAYDGTILISVKGESDEQQTTVLATSEEIQQVFSIMQMNATEGAEAIAGVKSENILILLHAADSRKTIKSAAKEQADKLFSSERVLNETTGANMEGADS